MKYTGLCVWDTDSAALNRSAKDILGISSNQSIEPHSLKMALTRHGIKNPNRLLQS